MTKIARELDDRLRQLDGPTARRVVNLVRDLLAVVRPTETERDAKGFPIGYFERTAGSFANEPLERPVQPLLAPREEW